MIISHNPLKYNVALSKDRPDGMVLAIFMLMDFVFDQKPFKMFWGLMKSRD